MATNNFIELKTKSENIIKKGWIECPMKNSGNVGLLFERLLGLTNHNFSIPDYDGIEIKTKIKNSIPKITLFNATPDSYLYPIKRIYETYGYPDCTNRNFKAFNLSFCTNRRTYVNKKTYAKLYVDRKNKQVILKFFNENNRVIDNETEWSFKMLVEKLDIKLKYLFLMHAERKRLQGKCLCRYLKFNFFKYNGFDSFLRGLEKGYIKITFAINTFKSGKRYGQIHDHGTAFDIDMSYIQNVFTPLDI